MEWYSRPIVVFANPVVNRWPLAAEGVYSHGVKTDYNRISNCDELIVVAEVHLGYRHSIDRSDRQHYHSLPPIYATEYIKEINDADMHSLQSQHH